MKVEGRGIADNNQIDFIAFQETTYAFYEPVIIADVAEGIVNHCSVGDGSFEQFASCGGHFWASYAEEFDIVSALF